MTTQLLSDLSYEPLNEKILVFRGPIHKYKFVMSRANATLKRKDQVWHLPTDNLPILMPLLNASGFGDAPQPKKVKKRRTKPKAVVDDSATELSDGPRVETSVQSIVQPSVEPSIEPNIEPITVLSTVTSSPPDSEFSDPHSERIIKLIHHARDRHAQRKYHRALSSSPTNPYLSEMVQEIASPEYSSDEELVPPVAASTESTTTEGLYGQYRLMKKEIKEMKRRLVEPAKNKCVKGMQLL